MRNAQFLPPTALVQTPVLTAGVSNSPSRPLPKHLETRLLTCFTIATWSFAGSPAPPVERKGGVVVFVPASGHRDPAPRRCVPGVRTRNVRTGGAYPYRVGTRLPVVRTAPCVPLAGTHRYAPHPVTRFPNPPYLGLGYAPVLVAVNTVVWEHGMSGLVSLPTPFRSSVTPPELVRPERADDLETGFAMPGAAASHRRPSARRSDWTPSVCAMRYSE